MNLVSLCNLEELVMSFLLFSPLSLSSPGDVRFFFLFNYFFPSLSRSHFNKLIVYFPSGVFLSSWQSSVRVAVASRKRAGRTIQLLPKNAARRFQISFWDINKKEYNGQVIV